MTIDRREFVKQAAAIGVTVGGGGFIAGFHEARPGGRADSRPGETARTGDPTPLRPPGALSEEDFLATCIRCMRCVDACPNHALVPIDSGSLPESRSRKRLAGTPTLHMRRASCMLCGGQEVEYLKCTEACPSGALQLIEKDREHIRNKVHIGLAVIDTELCYSYNNWSCGACYRACPLAGEAMTIGMWERPTINPEACVGCGCCERSCIRYPHAVRVRTASG